MTKVYGNNGIYAEVIQDSCDNSNANNRLTTVAVKYGLIVHAEFLRHRQLSRGVKSNRAIPMKTIRSEVLSDPYVPVWFGAAQKGMVADNEMSWKWLGRQVWRKSRYPACAAHWVAEKLGAHKEWANRLLNPWQFVRETITATEWDNLFNLRLHRDAQKDIQEVVECVHKAMRMSKPSNIESGEYHVPYVDRVWENRVIKYKDTNGKYLTVDEAIKCSAARCARSSYDNHDGSSASLEKDLPLYRQLIDSDPKHASPVEHQGTPLERAVYNKPVVSWEEFFDTGTTHVDKSGQFWSGNFKGFLQYRQTLADHTCTEFTK